MKTVHSLLIFLVILFCSISVHAAPSVSVVFVLDESGSISDANFALETEGFQQALSALPLDASIEISVVGFSSSYSVLIDKEVLDANSLSTIGNALENNPKEDSGTRMSTAISVSAGLLDDSSAPTKVICLATDGIPNSQSATTLAADSAKNSGIILSPIGIGLDSYGKNFLDSIASDPPIPNPSNYIEFGTVVTNVILGTTASALNLYLTPEIVDFGTTDQQCTTQESIGFLNRSNQPAQITGIALQGEDAADFRIVTALGVSFDALSLPVDIPGLYSTLFEVALEPSSYPADGTYDASLVVTGTDATGTTADFTATLSAGLDSSCLQVSVIDAHSVISNIDSSDVPLDSEGNEISENKVLTAIKSKTYDRSGLVADGNARLFISATTSVTSGTVRFEIVQPSQTEAVLGTLGSTSNSGGATSIEVSLSTNDDGMGQATAILRAGERFLGASGEAEITSQVRVCLLDNPGGSCTAAIQSKQIRERRAPVVLIHGLWSDNSAWEKGLFDSHAMKPDLENANFRVGMFEYHNWEGPTVTMQSNNRALSSLIDSQCEAEELEKFACTRNDIAGTAWVGWWPGNIFMTMPNIITIQILIKVLLGGW